LSTDAGHTWTRQATGIPVAYHATWGWEAIASDATGAHLAAVSATEGIWTANYAPITLTASAGATLDLVYTGGGVWSVLTGTGSILAD
jgi:hypothetical protein